MANPFDVFDETQRKENPFDMFSSSQQKPAMEHTQYSRVRPVQSSGSVLDLLRGGASGIGDIFRGAQQRGAEFFSSISDDPVIKGIKDKLYAEEEARRERREFDPNVTTAEKAGNTGGKFAGTLPLAFAPGGQTAVSSTLMSLLGGGAAGSLLPTTSGSEALMNAGVGAGTSAAGNLVGRAILPTSARTLSQAQKDILDAASQEKIPLRTSEATGSNVIKNWEQMRANRPITGGMEQRFNKAQTEAINRAFTRRLGEEMPEVNDKSLLKFRDEIGGEVSGMVRGRNVPLDNDFFSAVVDVDSKAHVGGKLTSSPEIERTVNNALDLIANRTQVRGEVAQQIRSKLMDKARDARAQENTELANGLEELVDGLKKAMTGTMTDAEKQAWAEANRRYANYKLVEEAFTKDPRSLAQGDVPINKMARVLEQNRPRSYVHGTGDFAGLAKLGQVIRPPGRSALLGESSMPIVRNAMDVASGAAYPILESQLMQRYLTGGLPIQKSIRDVPGMPRINDSLLRAVGLSLGLDDEYRN